MTRPQRVTVVASRLPMLVVALAACLALPTAAQDDAGEIRLTHPTSYRQLEGPDGPTLQEDFGIAAAPLGDFDGDGIEDLAVLGEDSLWLVFLDERDRPHGWKKIDLTAWQFGRLSSITALGDVNGDGVPDLAIGTGPVGVLILLLAPNGSVLSTKLFSLPGRSVAALGDLDGDGVPDLAVSGTLCTPPAMQAGTVWIVFLNADGSAKSSVPIRCRSGSAGNCSCFGSSLSWGGPGGADGAPQLAVGGDGLFWILTLAPDGTVTSERTVSLASLGLPDEPFIGRTVTWLGDIDHDGVDDLAFSKPSFGGLGGGVVVDFGLWVVRFREDGSPKGVALMEGTQGGYTFPTPFSRRFPTFLTSLPDRDGDGVRKLLASSSGTESGRAFELDNFAIFYLNDGFTNVPRKLGVNNGIPQSFGLGFLGSSVAPLGDLDGDGRPELALGVPGDSAVFGGTAGALWIVSLETDGQASGALKLGAGLPTMPPGSLTNARRFGLSLAPIGDLDDDGVGDLLAGGTLPFGQPDGAAWVLFLHADGSVRNVVELAAQFSGLPAALDPSGQFGTAVTGLGDLDGDGIEDVAVGAPGSLFTPGSVWILFLNADATIRAAQKIAAGVGGLGNDPSPGDAFGQALASLGDVDGDGNIELAVGAPGCNDGGKDRGALWILSLAVDGQVIADRTLSQTSGGFPGTLANDDAFGSAISFGPMTVGSPPVLAVGAPGIRLPGFVSPAVGTGAVWILWPRRPGTLGDPFVGERFLRLDGASAPFAPVNVDAADALGSSLAWLGDIDGDGTSELAVGAPGDDEGAFYSFVDPDVQADVGAFWITCPAACRWRNLGLGLAGSSGIPQLVGRGSLVAGDEVELHLSDALPGSTAALVAGTVRADIPFLGGVLVPRPDRVILGLPVSDHGTHSYRALWRAPLPQQVAFHFQFLVIDPATPMGVAASNAVVALFP